MEMTSSGGEKIYDTKLLEAFQIWILTSSIITIE